MKIQWTLLIENVAWRIILLTFSHIYLIHCSSGPRGSSMLAPLSLDIKACIPPVTPPLDEFPELWLLDLFLLGADNGDELIGSGLEWRKGDMWRATSPWSSFDPGIFFRRPLMARVVALLLKLPFEGDSGLVGRIFFART